MHALMERAGETPFPDDAIRILSEPIIDSLVEIKPNGAVYVPHPHYRDRLDRAFGPGGWALVPLAPAKMNGNRVVWWGFLKARGQYIDSAIGGCTYVASNAEMNYDDAVEGAKSDCLVRCCKSLPLFRECWDKDYADYWKATYADQGVTPYSKGKLVWKKSGAALPGFTRRPDRQGQSPFDRQQRLEHDNQQHINSIMCNERVRVVNKDEYYDHDPNEAEQEARDREAYMDALTPPYDAGVHQKGGE